ncbi:MAG TPA: HAD-IC family P-type ATPase [Burkholderiales bacterium]|jgi:cation transport ATPase
MKTAHLIKLPIEGMTCASCVARVEKALKAVPGVASAEVNLATETATVSLAEGAPPQSLVAAVEKAGYVASLAPVPKPTHDRSWWPVALAAVLTLPLLAPMLVGWSLPGWVQLALATPVQTVVLTGDNRAAAEAIGAKLGIDEVRAEVLPADKAEAMSSLGKTYRTAMVGDGVNDAPALAAARLGIAMGSGTDVAMHAAGVTLMRPDPRLVGAAIDISRRTYAKIRQNLFWAFVYNVVGIPLAALGILTPVIAGAAMALSSVSVVANALLLKRWKPEE